MSSEVICSFLTLIFSLEIDIFTLPVEAEPGNLVTLYLMSVTVYFDISNQNKHPNLDILI